MKPARVFCSWGRLMPLLSRSHLVIMDKMGNHGKQLFFTRHRGVTLFLSQPRATRNSKIFQKSHIKLFQNGRAIQYVVFKIPLKMGPTNSQKITRKSPNPQMFLF